MVEVDLFGEPVVNGHKSVLAQTFDYPPFSVLNAREGWWQERKRQWLSLGIKSEVGRGGDLIPNGGEEQSRDRYNAGGAGKPITPQKGLTWGNSPEITQKGLKLLPRQKAAAFDTRGGLATWQRDKRK
jgi:hypothetical protein